MSASAPRPGRDRTRTSRTRTASRAPSPQRTSTPPARRVPRGGLRGRLDAFGGPVVVGTIVLTIAILIFAAVKAWPKTPSTKALMGDPVTITSATHVSTAAELQIPDGQPPAG